MAPKVHFANVAGNKYVQSDYGYLIPLGNIFYVGSLTGADSVGNGFSPEAPFATVAFAITQCVANNGDVIRLMPGHAESIAVAGGITCNVAGVTIEGIGRGSQRATLTFSAVGSTLLVSAANVTLRNFILTVSVDEVVKLISVTAAGCLIDGVDYVEASGQAIQFLLTSALATDLEIRNCRHVQGTAAAASQRWIQLLGADRAYVHDNTFLLKLSDIATSCVIGSAATAPVDVEIARNTIVMRGFTSNLLSAILLVNGTIGIVHDNRIAADVAAVTTVNDGGNTMKHAENYCVITADKSGILDPVV